MQQQIRIFHAHKNVPLKVNSLIIYWINKILIMHQLAPTMNCKTTIEPTTTLYSPYSGGSSRRYSVLNSEDFIALWVRLLGEFPEQASFTNMQTCLAHTLPCMRIGVSYHLGHHADTFVFLLSISSIA